VTSLLALFLAGLDTPAAHSRFPRSAHPRIWDHRLNTPKCGEGGYCTSPMAELYIDSDRPGGTWELDVWIATRATDYTILGVLRSISISYQHCRHGLWTEHFGLRAGTLLHLQWQRQFPYLGGHAATVSSPWGPSVSWGSHNSSSPGHREQVSLADGSSCFCSDRPGGPGLGDLWYQRRGTAHSPGSLLVLLGGSIKHASEENSTMPFSPDGLWLFL